MRAASRRAAGTRPCWEEKRFEEYQQTENAVRANPGARWGPWPQTQTQEEEDERRGGRMIPGAVYCRGGNAEEWPDMHQGARPEQETPRPPRWHSQSPWSRHPPPEPQYQQQRLHTRWQEQDMNKDAEGEPPPGARRTQWGPAPWCVPPPPPPPPPRQPPPLRERPPPPPDPPPALQSEQTMRLAGASPPRAGGGGKIEATKPERPSEGGQLDRGMTIEQMLAVTVRLQHAEVLSRMISAPPIAQQLQRRQQLQRSEQHN